MNGDYVKIIGLKFDPLEGLDIVADANRKNMTDAGVYAEENSDSDTIWIGVPCKYIVD